MTLLRQESDKKQPSGKAIYNYFLAWQFEGKVHYIKIRALFKEETKFLNMNAIHVPQGEPLEKYI